MVPRRARIGVSIVFLVCGAAFATWASRVPAAQERLGLTEGELALGLFGLAGGSVLALLVAGALVTVIGSRRTSIVGATVLCAGLPAVAAAPDLGLFVAALAVLGVGNSLLDVAMNAHAARVEDAYGRPIFAGFHAFWSIGGLAGSGLAAGLAAADVPIGVHFPVVAAVLLAVALAAAGPFLPGPDPGAGGPAFSLPGRALVPLGVIAFCGFLAEGTVNDWSAVLLTTETGASESAASLGYFAFSITMIGVRLAADRFVARAGAVLVMRIAAVVTVVGFAVVTVVPVPAVGIAGFAVVGLGVAAIVPVAWSVAAQKEQRAPGRAIAAVATCGYLGFLVGPVLVGALASAIGLSAAVAAAGAASLAVLLLAPALRVRPVAADPRLQG